MVKNTPNKPSEYFDFFSIGNFGKPRESVLVEEKDGSKTKNFMEPGMVETFSYGWNVETTYGLYKERIDALLMLAEQHEPETPCAQALLSSAVILMVSGLESLVKVAGKPEKKPYQTIDDFLNIVKNLNGYRSIDERYRNPLGRLFEVRHAIVHAGWRVTENLKGRIDSRSSPGEELKFNVENVREVLAAVDHFVESVAGCFVSFDEPKEEG